ncbi:MAG: type II toxin-antitoxin system VapC family toxin [Candidatus Aenigmarchaeota archaeon]|nr:type II toxin-antitoxin system VapC family toxin [Candidatus Aenigmarchaeota archaeon]
MAILRGNEQALEKSKSIDEEGKAFTTSINAYEILFGAKKSKKEANLEESRKILAKLLMLPFDEKASEKASDIHKELSQKGTQLDLRDIFIASIAISNGCSLVTRNTKHFSKIKELKTEKW